MRLPPPPSPRAGGGRAPRPGTAVPAAQVSPRRGPPRRPPHAPALAIAAALALALAPSAAPPRPDTAAITVAAYRANLWGWETAIRALPSAAAAGQLLRRTPPHWRIVMRPAIAGQPAVTVTVPAGWLRRGLRAIAQAGEGGGAGAVARGKLLRRLRQREALARPPLAAGILAARRQMLAAILAQREFTAPSRHTVAEAIRQQIAAWLAAVWRRWFGALPPGRTGGWMLLAAVLAAALGSIALAASRWRRGRRGAAADAAGPADRGAAGDAAAWLRRARQAAAEGNDAAAALHGYQAGLMFGAAAGWWRLRAAGTPREYLHCLPAGHFARSEWRGLTASLERWRYAGRDGAAEAARAILQALAGLGCR